LRPAVIGKDEAAASDAMLEIATIADPNAIGALEDVLACDVHFKMRSIVVVPLAQMRNLKLKPPEDDEPFETMTTAEWRVRLAELRRALDGDDKEAAEAARLAICRIRDPNAFGVVKQMLLRDKDFEVRRMLTVPLARTGGDEALPVLADLAVKDAEVKGEAALALVLLDRAAALPLVAKYLHNRRYQAQAVQTLALAQLIEPLEQDQKPDQQLTIGLIDALALKTIGRTQVPAIVPTGSITARGFTGSRGFSFYSRRTYALRNVTVNVVNLSPNEIALDLLQQYTGADHQFDLNAWTKWYRESPKSYFQEDQNEQH
jgi:hypothetical protein